MSEDDRSKSASDILKEQEAELAVLRAALIEGEESGPSEPFDFDTFLARKRKEKSRSE